MKKNLYELVFGVVIESEVDDEYGFDDMMGLCPFSMRCSAANSPAGPAPTIMTGVALCTF